VPSGPKGPTLLVAPNHVTTAELTLSDTDLGDRSIDIKVVTEVTFLGMLLYIDPLEEVVVAASTPKSRRAMGFFAHELGKSLQLIHNSSALNFEQKRSATYKAACSTATMLESRIQYGICYADRSTIQFYINIHRKAVCALLGFTPRFFGFKWLTCQRAYVSDLVETIGDFSSATYVRLCQLAGRPTVMQLASRAVRVIESQFFSGADAPGDGSAGENTSLRRRKSKFTRKIECFREKFGPQFTELKPRDHPMCRALNKCTSIRERRRFVRIATDTFISQSEFSDKALKNLKYVANIYKVAKIAFSIFSTKRHIFVGGLIRNWS